MVAKSKNGRAQGKPSGPSTALIIGAKKFLFSREALDCPRLRWWGAVANDDAMDAAPENLGYIYIKRSLARKAEAEDLGKRTGAALIEFIAESEIFFALHQFIGFNPELGSGPARASNPLSDPEEVQPSARDMELESDRVIDIPVSRIRRFEGQPREFFDDSKLRALGRSMLKAGQKVPIIVVPVKGDPSHDYQLYDGERRWRAAQMVHKPTLRAVVARAASNAEMFKGSAVCNFGREDHQPMETAIALRRIKAAEDLTLQDLADMFSRSLPWVTQHLSLLRLDATVQQRLNAGLPEGQQLGFTTALEVAKLPSPIQPEAVTHILSHHLDLHRARHYVRLMIKRHGTSYTVRKRDSFDDLKLFRRFLERTILRSEELMNMADRTLEQLFSTRTPTERRDALESIDQVVQRLESMKVEIRRAKRAA